MSRKIFVSNLPVRAYVDAWVEIPNDPEDFDDAIAEAVKEGKFEFDKKTLSVEDDGVEVDESVLDKWEFQTPMEES